MSRIVIGTLHFNNTEAILTALDRNGDFGVPDAKRLFIDDGSTPEAYERLRLELERRTSSATLVRDGKNRGVCVRLNEYLWNVESEYLAWVSDDWLDTTHIPSALEALERSGPRAAAYFCPLDTVDAKGQHLAHYHPGNSLRARGRDDLARWFSRDGVIPGRVVAEALMLENVVTAPTVVLRRSAVRAVGGWDETLRVEDYDMWLRLARNHDFVWASSGTAKYVVHGGNTSMRNTWRIALDGARTIAKNLDVAPTHRSRWTGTMGVLRYLSRAARSALRSRSPEALRDTIVVGTQALRSTSRAWVLRRR